VTFRNRSSRVTERAWPPARRDVARPGGGTSMPEPTVPGPPPEPARPDPVAEARAKVAEARGKAIASLYMIPVWFLALIPKVGDALVAVVVFVVQGVVVVLKVAVALLPQATLGVLILCVSLILIVSGLQT